MRCAHEGNQRQGGFLGSQKSARVNSFWDLFDPKTYSK